MNIKLITDIVAFSMAFLFIITSIMFMIAMVWFKRRESDYKELLNDFISRGLELDSITAYYSGSGAINAYQQVIYFVRLHKGIKMKRFKNKMVHQEAYDFIQK
ncbi:hypothetical protein [Erwinia billingiae]|uniref:hypothetical protein n=1 Tax=Erwinia billingiae TaxID=182337 RepID=UPI002245B9F5|nr:hypothetical protein [Erwinia billingiae]MCX0501417.1 hypothetical protein [Erwinia billingiae]